MEVAATMMSAVGMMTTATKMVMLMTARVMSIAGMMTVAAKALDDVRRGKSEHVHPSCLPCFWPQLSKISEATRSC